MVGYFEGTQGTQQQMIEAWHTFVCGTTGSTTPFYPIATTVITDGTVPLINPVNGEIQGILIGDSITTTGDSSLDLLPPQTQALINWRTGIYRGGREVRGKTFYPLRAETENTSQGVPTPGLIGSLRALADALVNSSSVNHVVWSKTQGLWESTMDYNVPAKWAVLRSRRD